MTFKVSSARISIRRCRDDRVRSGPSAQGGDAASVKSLANSIGKMGVIQPLVVRPADGSGHHTVIAGERRQAKKVSRKVAASALSQESGRRKKNEEPAPIASRTDIPPREELPAAPRGRVNPGKVKLVAETLDLSVGDEEEILEQLIGEFPALKRSKKRPHAAAEILQRKVPLSARGNRAPCG